ncbi:MAG: hypothetical protein QXI58_00875 [Candidatus Micrarchaeia archaeon]
MVEELVRRAKKIVDAFFKQKIPNLSYGVAIYCPDLTNEQIKRIIALVNLITFYRFFHQLKDKNFAFELASFPKVLKYLKEKADAVKQERQRIVKERAEEEEVREAEITDTIFQEPKIEEIERFFTELLNIKPEEKKAEDPILEAFLGENINYYTLKNFLESLRQFKEVLKEHQASLPNKLILCYDKFYSRLREQIDLFPLKMIYTLARQYFPEPISKRDIDICGAFFETACEELKAKNLIKDEDAYLEVDTNLLRGYTANPADPLLKAIEEAKDIITRYYIIKSLLPEIEKLYSYTFNFFKNQ